MYKRWYVQLLYDAYISRNKGGGPEGLSPQKCP